MIPRERVLRCLNHEGADRVPLSGSFRPEIWEKLKKYYGTDSVETIREILGFDFKSAGMGLAKDFVQRAVSTDWGGMAIPHDDGTYETEWGVRIAPGKNKRYMRYIHCPLADESNLDSALAEIVWS